MPTLEQRLAHLRESMANDGGELSEEELLRQFIYNAILDCLDDAEIVAMAYVSEVDQPLGDMVSRWINSYGGGDAHRDPRP